MPGRRRDATRTREQILDAARAEFGAHGFNGARVEAIARRAGVTKPLVFYYFDNKEKLFEAVAQQRIDDTKATATGPHGEDPFAWSLAIFEREQETLDWVRFFIWEGLSAADYERDIRLVDERRRGFRQRTRAVADAQTKLELPPDLDARQLTLFLYVLGVYPYALPQIAYMITGMSPTDERFRKSYTAFIRRLAAHLRPAKD